MKAKTMMLAAVALAATPALAASGEVSGSADGHSKIAACERAKVDAKGAAAVAAMGQAGAGPVRMTYYSRCECAENPPPAVPTTRWTCSVTARFTREPD